MADNEKNVLKLVLDTCNMIVSSVKFMTKQNKLL